MTSPAKPLLLKIVSGPHAGAEMVLAESEYRIGQSADCDVVLSDPQVSEQHVRLTVSGDRLAVASLSEAPVLVEGEAVTETAMGAFQFLTIGHTTLTFGPQDVEWPQRDFIAPSLAATATDSPSDSESTMEESDACLEPAVSADTEQTQAAAPRRTTMLIVSALMGLAVCAVVGFLVSGALADTPEAVGQTTVADLDAIVKQIAPLSSVVVSEEDGTFTARGFVFAKSKAGELKDALREAAPRIDTSKIRDAQTIRTLIAGVLRPRGLSELSVADGDQPGHVIVSGVTEHVSEWEKARVEIERNTPVVSLINHVNREFAKVPGPEPESEIDPEPVAEPATEETPETEVAVSEPAPVVEESTPTPAYVPQQKAAAGLPFRIVDVSIGRRSFFTLEGGVRVYRGAEIRGHRVVSIADGVIVLERDGQEVIVRTRASI